MAVIDSWELAEYLGVVADGQSEPALSTAITVAESYLEGYLGKLFVEADRVDHFDRFTIPLKLSRSPVQSVAQLTYLDSDGNQQTLDPAKYVASPLGADEATYIYPKNGGWPQSYPVAGAISCTYTAGYGTAPVDMPAPIRAAALRLAAHVYVQGAAVDQLASSIPPDVVELVSGYRDWQF